MGRINRAVAAAAQSGLIELWHACLGLPTPPLLDDDDDIDGDYVDDDDDDDDVWSGLIDDNDV